MGEYPLLADGRIHTHTVKIYILYIFQNMHTKKLPKIFLCNYIFYQYILSIYIYIYIYKYILNSHLKNIFWCLSFSCHRNTFRNIFWWLKLSIYYFNNIFNWASLLATYLAFLSYVLNPPPPPTLQLFSFLPPLPSPPPLWCPRPLPSRLTGYIVSNLNELHFGPFYHRRLWLVCDQFWLLVFPLG